MAEMELDGDLSERMSWIDTADEPDWDAVYAEQLPRVYNYFRYRIRNDAVAEDLTSQTFEKAWRARRRYRRDLAGFGTWLLTIARNVAIDHLRTRRDHRDLDEAADVAADRTPEDEGARASDLERLAILVADLSEREQELLALKYGAEATNRAIARITDMTESNVGTILHRIVQRLRRDW
ncbi:MAG TPA: sigma-70 family RNA polymerase sigma factor [Gammaproteobacteria bacterium]|nr:sigma-70 family RNA polymerase sigma factor [Gammaproteobacteria bacterium]